MAAGTYNFTIEQGATFNRTVTWQSGSPPQVVDLTNSTAELSIWLIELGTAPMLVLTDQDGLTLGGTAGTIAINIPSEVTSALDFLNASYTLTVTSATNTVRLLQGSVTLSRQNAP